MTSGQSEGMTNQTQVVDILIKIGNSIDPKDFVTTMCPKATELVTSDPFAFLLAVCLDRGSKSEIIWTIPWAIHNRLGHLDPGRFMDIKEDCWIEIIDSLPYKPRYTSDAPRTILDLSRIVVNEFGGKAQAIWEGRSALEVERVFKRVHGVGSGIAAMGLNLIETVWGTTFTEQDHRYIDLKPDVHVVRVFYRTGLVDVADPVKVVEKARVLRLNFSGELDKPGWKVGREWCHETKPDCPNCPLDSICPKVGLPDSDQ